MTPRDNVIYCIMVMTIIIEAHTHVQKRSIENHDKLYSKHFGFFNRCK